MKKLSILLAGILLAGSAYGAVGITNYESVKQKAMGGATILSEVNENAIVNNPALLNEINGWELNIAGMSVSVSAETPEIANGISSMMTDLKDLEEADIITVLTAYLDGEKVIIGSNVYNEDEFKLSNKKLVLELTSVITAFAKKGFGAGIFVAANVNELKLVNKPSSPEITVDMGMTVQVPVGVAFDFGKKNQYIIGTSIKGIGGANAHAKVNAGDLAAGDDASIPVTVESYSGMALDLGTIYKSKYLNYALTVNNAFSNIQVITKEGDNPESDAVSETLPMSINVAISNKFDKVDRIDAWWDKYAFWTLELKNITSSDVDGDGFKDENLYKKIHFGASSHVFNNNWVRLELRGGLNQGYPTFGIGSELFSFLNFDYAYSTRELGFTAGSKPETLHSFTIDFRL